ncbi:hypothetical protein EBU94_07030, partial [bacterium]|nr:hypothetical protein [bacterium]
LKVALILILQKTLDLAEHSMKKTFSISFQKLKDIFYAILLVFLMFHTGKLILRQLKNGMAKDF